MSESEPIPLRPHVAAACFFPLPQTSAGSTTSFDRRELGQILAVYGRKVAAGEWHDYAIDFERDKAVFSVFRRACERPLYRIEKDPRLTHKQGAYSIVATTGLILRRGHDLKRVLGALERTVRLVDSCVQVS